VRKKSNKAMQYDPATCHALCLPHKDVPDCFAVDGGVNVRFQSMGSVTLIDKSL
jgi:hypothetical protein